MGLLDTLLDASVVASFDRRGFARHAARFLHEPERSLQGRDIVITGGTAGIGLATVEALADRGARLHIWGRDRAKGEATVAAVRARGGTALFTSVDLGDLQAVGEAARALSVPGLAGVVLCAGAMPLARTLTPQGHELVWASQVLGHALLLRVLRQADALGPQSRVVWVSSGGMYMAPLDLSDLGRERGYARHAVYAHAKRAQVELSAWLSQAWPDVPMASMHPGWVDTAAVQLSMPLFHRLTTSILRTSEEGADTVVWLISREDPPATGCFWFDRTARATTVPGGRAPSPSQVQALADTVWAQTEAFTA